MSSVVGAMRSAVWAAGRWATEGGCERWRGRGTGRGWRDVRRAGRRRWCGIRSGGVEAGAMRSVVGAMRSVVWVAGSWAAEGDRERWRGRGTGRGWKDAKRVGWCWWRGARSGGIEAGAMRTDGAMRNDRYMLTYGTQAGPACTNSNPPPRAHTHPTSPSAPLLWHGQARTLFATAVAQVRRTSLPQF